MSHLGIILQIAAVLIVLIVHGTCVNARLDRIIRLLEAQGKREAK